MSQALGIVEIGWGGVWYDVVPKSAKIQLPGLRNNPVAAGRRTHRSQEFVPGKLTATTVFKRGQRHSDIYSEDEKELQVKYDTGQTYVFADAFIEGGPPEVSEDGGKAEITWTLPGSYEEIMS